MSNPDSSPLQYRCHLGLAGLEALRPAWLDLLARVPGPQRMCHNPFWYRCYLRHLIDDDNRMGFVGAYRGDRLVAIVPLMNRTRTRWGFSLRALELPSDRANHLRDIVVDPDLGAGLSLRRAASAAARAGSIRGDLFVLDQVLDDAHLVKAGLLRPDRRNAFVMSRCYHHALGPGFAVREIVSAHFRKALNNKRNRLARVGAIAHKAWGDPPDIDPAIDTFLEVEASGWKGQSGAGSALKYEARRIAFLRELVSGGDGLRCQVHLLHAGATPAAGAFCILLDRVLYVLHIGFDEQFAKMSPGHLLIHDLLTHACASGTVDEVNYLSGAAWYDQWRPLSRGMYRVYGWPRNPQGCAAVCAGLAAMRLGGARVEGGRRVWLRESGKTTPAPQGDPEPGE